MPLLALPANRGDRIALIVIPCRPITFPTSCGCKRNSYTVVPSRSTGVIVTESGCWTRPLTTYSRNVCMDHQRSGSGRSSGLYSGFVGLFDKACNGFAGLGAFAKPILCAVQIECIIIALFQRLICAQFLN